MRKWFWVGLILLGMIPEIQAFNNLTYVEVQNRLLGGDTLLLLDVREVSEYEAGHIAEPEGLLPVTPAILPLNSFVLSNEIQRLPDDIDIIVYCRSGSRSASASRILENNGFTRIYNLSGGFSSWPYESRSGGFGDHSGSWIDQYVDYEPRTIYSPDSSGRITLSNTSLPENRTRFYLEIHRLTEKQLEVAGLSIMEPGACFRVTLLDDFGLPLFSGDSLALSDLVSISLASDVLQTDLEMQTFVPGRGWIPVESNLSDGRFIRLEPLLRKWYRLASKKSTALAEDDKAGENIVRIYPNPFNNELKIYTPWKAKISIYDLQGRLVERVSENRWIPDPDHQSGIYFIMIEYSGRKILRKVTYLK
ncbi:MAG: T9SS type A sorting domain-containing protein [Candidatus Marinimicrobia bacterium]|nr:T9SS type A sorting domain-containing protein [Candidatus Neomarinimicrobiota bacterium]